MLISKDQVIAGMPATEAREWCRLVRDQPITTARLVFNANYNAKKVQVRGAWTEDHVLNAMKPLQEAGLVERHETSYGTGHNGRGDESEGWLTTEAGNALAKARIGKPMQRAKGDRILSDLLDRVRANNDDPNGLWWVERVEVFGSHTTDKEMIGDVDVWLTVEPRLGWTEAHRLAGDALTEKTGRYFATYPEQMYWPKRELIQRLKNREQRLDFGMAFTEEERRGLPASANLVIVYERSNP